MIDLLYRYMPIVILLILGMVIVIFILLRDVGKQRYVFTFKLNGKDVDTVLAHTYVYEDGRLYFYDTHSMVTYEIAGFLEWISRGTIV